MLDLIVIEKNCIIKRYSMYFYVCTQESVEDMGLYEDVSGGGGASAQVQFCM